MIGTLMVLSACVIAEPGQRGPVLDAGIYASTPALLETGQMIGPMLAARLPGSLSLGLRLRGGQTAENDLSWRVEHTELSFALSATWVRPIGRGEVSLSLFGGGLGLHELRTRHQALRLESASLVHETSAWTAGGDLSLEVTVRLFVLDRWGVALNGGPRMVLLASESPRFGVTAGLSVSYDLGGGGP